MHLCQFILSHSDLGDRDDIFVTYLLSSSNKKYQSFPKFSYYSWLCLRWLNHHILRVTIIYIYIYICLGNRLWCVTIPDYIKARRSYLFCLHITRSHLNIYKIHVGYIVFLKLTEMQYVGLCVFSLPIYFVMIVIMCLLYLITIVKSDV